MERKSIFRFIHKYVIVSVTLVNSIFLSHFQLLVMIHTEIWLIFVYWPYILKFSQIHLLTLVLFVDSFRFPIYRFMSSLNKDKDWLSPICIYMISLYLLSTSLPRISSLIEMVKADILACFLILAINSLFHH